MTAATFAELPRRHFGVILVDPPWRFEIWSDAGKGRSADQHSATMTIDELRALDVGAGSILHHEDDESYSLQFELMNKCGVGLCSWKNGDRPSVRIWKGNGEHDFGEESFALFKEWVEVATCRRSPDDRPAIDALNTKPRPVPDTDLPPATS